jgi:uncharacterized LabA/DUF88 family protein
VIPVCVYIDGFNVFHALKRFHDDKVKWLDLAALVNRLILPKTEQVREIYYFSAYADWLPPQKVRHQEYVKALQSRGIRPILGQFKEKDRWCNSCGHRWKGHEEKETDVSIGIALLNDAYKEKYQRALLLTRDSDLVPAVKMVRQEFPQKEIIVVAPPMMGHSNDLIRVCNAKRKITPKQVWACLLPKQVLNPDGSVAVVRPAKFD